MSYQMLDTVPFKTVTDAEKDTFRLRRSGEVTHLCFSRMTQAMVLMSTRGMVPAGREV
jgi:hypothetical protein